MSDQQQEENTNLEQAFVKLLLLQFLFEGFQGLSDKVVCHDMSGSFGILLSLSDPFSISESMRVFQSLSASFRVQFSFIERENQFCSPLLSPL